MSGIGLHGTPDQLVRFGAVSLVSPFHLLRFGDSLRTTSSAPDHAPTGLGERPPQPRVKPYAPWDRRVDLALVVHAGLVLQAPTADAPVGPLHAVRIGEVAGRVAEVELREVAGKVLGETWWCVPSSDLLSCEK